MVMNPARVKTLKALAGSYIRQNKYGEISQQPPWSADFIQGKGKATFFCFMAARGLAKRAPQVRIHSPLDTMTETDGVCKNA